jgi:hypothetical protein
MTSRRLRGTPAGRLDAAIAAGEFEVVVLRLALGVLRTVDEVRRGADTTREEMLVALEELRHGFAATLEDVR